MNNRIALVLTRVFDIDDDERVTNSNLSATLKNIVYFEQMEN